MEYYLNETYKVKKIILNILPKSSYLSVFTDRFTVIYPNIILRNYENNDSVYYIFIDDINYNDENYFIFIKIPLVVIDNNEMNFKYPMLKTEIREKNNSYLKEMWYYHCDENINEIIYKNSYHKFEYPILLRNGNISEISISLTKTFGCYFILTF